MYTDFQSKLLYKQATTSEEGHDVLSCVYALSWKMPGSMASITTRSRMTIVTNFEDPNFPNVFAANIELWRETGWITLEEYFDDALLLCYGPEEIEAKCLRVLELFFVGSAEEDDNPKPEPKRPKTKVAVKRKAKPVKNTVPDQEEQKETNTDETKSESPDFDWI